jgi:hypothetical protein
MNNIAGIEILLNRFSYLEKNRTFNRNYIFAITSAIVLPISAGLSTT